jgi:2-haloacid dehalogenase
MPEALRHHWPEYLMEAVVFVSSNAFDVMGAKAYGFQVAWVNRTQAPADELGLVPDLVLSRLDELPPVFPAA